VSGRHSRCLARLKAVVRALFHDAVRPSIFLIESPSIFTRVLIHNTSMHLMAAWRGSHCYEAICRLANTEDAKRDVGFCVSYLAPYYLVYSWKWSRAVHRPVVRFDLDETEQPYAQRIAEEIEATYGFEPMPPEIGNVLVEDVELQGVRYHHFGKGTIYDYLFTISW
jgi:hypothetical protein